MYIPTDTEILDALEDFLDDCGDRHVTRHRLWLEAFKRGMRFNPITPPNQPDTLGANPVKKCAWCGYPEGYWAERRTVHCTHE